MPLDLKYTSKGSLVVIKTRTACSRFKDCGKKTGALAHAKINSIVIIKVMVTAKVIRLLK